MDILNTYFCQKCMAPYDLLEGKDDGRCPTCRCKGEYWHSVKYDPDTKKTIGTEFQMTDKGTPAIILPQQKQSIPNTTNNNSDIVKCPRCGSTQITTGARGVNNFWGLIGASKTVNRCAKCGNTWKPHL